jgi:hypothetical protein
MTLRVQRALGAAPSARFTARRAPAFGGLVGWTATGTAVYPATGPSPRALFTLVTEDGAQYEILVVGSGLYVREDGRWQTVSTSTLSVDGQRLDHEIRLTPGLLGQAAFIPTARFRRSPASGRPGTAQWTAFCTGDEWRRTLPAPIAEQVSAATGFDVLLYLDADGRPARRIDAVRPNNMEITIETAWEDWGVGVRIPTGPSGGMSA